MRLAGCIIPDRFGRVLLLHRNEPNLTHWELPGGKVESGEEDYQAAARELREEVGVVVAIKALLGSCLFEQDGNVPMSFSWFVASIASGRPRCIDTGRYDKVQYVHWRRLQDMRDTLSPVLCRAVEAISYGDIRSASDAATGALSSAGRLHPLQPSLAKT
jgi:8-oxo-dGTP diphosphatase